MIVRMYAMVGPYVAPQVFLTQMVSKYLAFDDWPVPRAIQPLRIFFFFLPKRVLHVINRSFSFSHEMLPEAKMILKKKKSSYMVDCKLNVMIGFYFEWRLCESLTIDT